MGKPGTLAQDRAVIREYEEAVAIGATEYAKRIALANQDLFIFRWGMIAPRPDLS